MGRTSDARERLVQATQELLYAGGYQGVGVDDICERAGVRKGSFYYFFPSKQELALEALDGFFEIGREGFIDPAFEDGHPPLERIRRFFDGLAESSIIAQKQTGMCGGCMFGNLAAEMGSHDPEILAKVRSMFDRLTGKFEKALRDAVAAGDVTDIDPRVNARSLMAYMEGILLLAKTANDASLLRTLAPNAMVLATAPRKKKRQRK
jgi:TetR/AcrR family transcriptional repressor of nem operon